MADQTDPIGAQARHDARMEMGNESVRGLFLVNGGGAVALLAFLQQIWTTQPDLARWVLVGLTLFTAGVALAAPINNVRAEASLFHQYGPGGKARRWRQYHLTLTWLSIACFVLGCLVVIVGGFYSLHEPPTAAPPAAAATSATGSP